MNKISHDMEPHEIATYVKKANPVILEIGCNDGTDTNKMLETFPGASIHCFDPDPRAVERFKRTVSSDRVSLNEVAISESDGVAVFHGSSGQPPGKQRNNDHYCRLLEWDLSGSLNVPTGHLKMSPWVTFPEDRQYEVETIRLDTWYRAADIGEVDFIWADVQGAEALLISGASETLRHTEWFYTEYYSTPMYADQPNLEEIQKMLPNFKLVALYGTTNALFKRIS